MKIILRDIRDFFVSLKLTVALLVLGMLLVFAATLDQTNLGIWGIQQKWFRTFVVFQDVRGVALPVYPGGYLIGGLLLLNLLGAHLDRFKFTWRKAGIFLTHAGLILLLVGEEPQRAHRAQRRRIARERSREEAAQKLGISPRTLRYKLARLRDAAPGLAAHS